MAKYGVKNISKLDEIKEKKKFTTQKNYGVDNPTYSHYNMENYKKLSKEYIEENFINDKQYFLLEKFKKFLNCNDSVAWKTIRKFGVRYKPRSDLSRPEEEIIEFIKELDPNTEIIQNTRDIIAPKELDIYLPDYNLAIEYNGLMFHSQGVSKFPMFNTPNLDRNIHLIKTEICEIRDIHLLHIFENEWLDPNLRDIWKSVIRNKLRKVQNKIGARKCVFAQKEQLLKESKAFLDNNHLQGGQAIGPVRYGLTHPETGELLALMTFGKSRFGDADYELIRFAIRKNWSIPGAASKLLKAFEREYPNKKLVSYANRRWSDGHLYKTIGFKLKNISDPNYYYFKPGKYEKLWHRASFQKHKLKGKLEKYNPNYTEFENMLQNGYRRIYDSGNYVFIK